jgi:hypothetical protein
VAADDPATSIVEASCVGNGSCPAEQQQLCGADGCDSKGKPAPAGDRFFGVRDAYVPGNASSRFRAAIIGNLPVSPLLTRTDNATGKSVDIVSKQFVTHFDVSYLPTNWLLLNADLRLVVSQSGDGQTSPSGSALGDARLGVRFGLVGGEMSRFRSVRRSTCGCRPAALIRSPVTATCGHNRCSRSAGVRARSCGARALVVYCVASTTAARRKSETAGC